MKMTFSPFLEPLKASGQESILLLRALSIIAPNLKLMHN
jgi:hypothetical protein